MEKLVIIRTLQALNELTEYLTPKDFIAVDTETTGVDKEAEIIGVSVAAETDLAYYVILSYWDVTTQSLVYLETKDGIKAFLQTLVGKSLIMQNAPFDCAMVNNNFGVELMPSVHTDTLMLGHLLNENRPNGLKERGVELYGEDARAEQVAMKESVYKNGGVLTKHKYELYKADADLMAHYGAKDALLTLKVFYHDVEDLVNQGLYDFFYKDETMPLLRGPTYDLNTAGLRVDPEKLSALRGTLEAECMEAKAFIDAEVFPHVKAKFPGTGKTNHFNINAPKQLAWLLFVQLGNLFHSLTKNGREVCKALNIDMPYGPGQKKDFIRVITENKGRVYEAAKMNWKTKKMSRPKKVEDFWHYTACGKESLAKLADRYTWVKRLLEYKKNDKILNTYVIGIQERMKYNVIRPSFLQNGTTSGRLSSRNPNFQNLPRDDKRVKSCIVSRPGKIFVGADFSQLEPRVFASQSGDVKLLECFKSGDDFYSVIGAEVFEKSDCTLKKDDTKDSFPVKYKKFRDISKMIALSSTYGTTAFKMAPTIGKSTEEAQGVINSYFYKFPGVQEFMLNAHSEAKATGQVLNHFGRPRRMPEAKDIDKIYPGKEHGELPYNIRNILNLAVNHKVQSTGASVMNRAAVEFKRLQAEYALSEPKWQEVHMVMQVHDEIILEGPEAIQNEMAALLKHCMENTVTLPGVDLIAEPKIANNLADLK